MKKELKNQGRTRSEIKAIDFSEHSTNGRKLEGCLVIEDFPQLEEIYLVHNKITSLKFINCPQVKEINCWGNNLIQLPIFSHPSVLRGLNIRDNQFSDSLDLSAFKNLEVLNCLNNKITDLNWASLPNSLTLLILSWNSLATRDLSVFSQLVNLEKLSIDNDKERFEKSKHNQFIGSFKSLQKLTKLETLNVNYTEVNSNDLEYLPESLQEIRCHPNQFLELEKYKKQAWDPSQYDYQAWGTANRELTTNCLPLQALFQQIKSLLVLNHSFLVQAQAVERITKKIQAANYAQYFCATVGAIGSIAGGYYSIPGGYTSGLAGFLGVFVAL